MTATVNVDVSHHTIAALAGEAVLAVAFFGRGFVPLHCQVVVGHLQLLVGRLGVQLERLAWWRRRKRKKKQIDFEMYLNQQEATFCVGVYT